MIPKILCWLVGHWWVGPIWHQLGQESGRNDERCARCGKWQPYLTADNQEKTANMKTGINVRKLCEDAREYAEGRIDLNEAIRRHAANLGDATDQLAAGWKISEKGGMMFAEFGDGLVRVSKYPNHHSTISSRGLDVDRPNTADAFAARIIEAAAIARFWDAASNQREI